MKHVGWSVRKVRIISYMMIRLLIYCILNDKSLKSSYENRKNVYQDKSSGNLYVSVFRVEQSSE
jgi:hypothetical protein